MGTRSTLHIKDDDGTNLVSLYRQYDGYPTGMGMEIKTALNNGQVELLNGFDSDSFIPKNFNGMACLGAFIIGALKGVKADVENYTFKGATGQIGGIYLTTPDDRQAYDYFLAPTKDGSTVNMRVETGGREIFNGLLSEFDGQLVEENE